MVQTKCGFDSQGGIDGAKLLAHFGPTLLVDIGFDPGYVGTVTPPMIPASSITNVEALVDTGSSECCIDNLLAAQLNLPIVDRRPIAGAHGLGDANMHLAQMHVPALRFTVYGMFAGVALQEGGQRHKALIGRTLLLRFTMVYEGRTGTVTISSD